LDSNVRAHHDDGLFSFALFREIYDRRAKRMAKPKNEEEQRIYEELKKKYKNEGRTVEKVKNDESDKRDWKTVREQMRDLL